MKKWAAVILNVCLLSSMVFPAFSEKNDTYIQPVYYENASGPVIGVTAAGVLEADGLYFRDGNSNGTLDPWEDWRLDDRQRAESLVSAMTLRQKAGFTMNALWTDPLVYHLSDALDESGEIDIFRIFPMAQETPSSRSPHNTATFNSSYLSLDGTRAGVYRGDFTMDADVIAVYSNIANQLCEQEALLTGEPAIPFVLISNPIYEGLPGTLGMAAAVMGQGDTELLKACAGHDREMWVTSGLRIMYGPQIDLATDPRWSRNKHTFGEVPEVVSDVITALTDGYQSGLEGLNSRSVALMMKHFPGDGAAENGFEAHRLMGQWRIYATPGSLEKYHLPAFEAAIEANIASVMPGYSRPAADGRTEAQTYHGTPIQPEEVANAFNAEILTKLLREEMGFRGYVNSDSSIASSKNYGVEELSREEEYALAISAGVDVIGDIVEPEYIIRAVEEGLLPVEDLDRACVNHAESVFRMGLFENPYADPEKAKATRAEYEALEDALRLNLASIVLLKNEGAALPIQGAGLKVCVLSFAEKGPSSRTERDIENALREMGCEIVEEDEAEIVYIHVNPALNSTDHLGVIDLVSGVPVEERNNPLSQDKTGRMITCTTVDDVAEIADVSRRVHERGGKVIGAINIQSPWILTNLEPYCDALLAVFDSSPLAQAMILTGREAPGGRLPITLPSSESVIAVEEREVDGVIREICVSPNDVPGYDKDQYMDPSVLSSVPGGSYAYRDTAGNYYRAGFSISYGESHD
ncbi:MAG: glycoside hydrolase family 3 protein [Clostridia bacterium]|nr:glycoside hydrolase family 3 protein [Clostridia bacterium]